MKSMRPRNKWIAFPVGAWCLVAGLSWLVSCGPDEALIERSGNVTLRFSTDTVAFDTIFSTLGSITRRFKVYNPARHAIQLSDIRLLNAGNSPFTLVINGEERNAAQNIRLFGRDSLLILVRATIDPRDKNLPFLIEDEVIFRVEGETQSVVLQAWGQDANIIRSGGGRTPLDCNTVWTAERPYVVFDTLVVLPNCNFTLEAGTQVYMAPRAAILVAGTLEVSGTPEKRVVFQSIRQDRGYAVQPGQWGGIFFVPGSKDNDIAHATLRNGTIGLYMGSPSKDISVTVSNTIIENMAFAGVQCINSEMLMVNSLVHNCVRHAILCQGGGEYTFIHNTIAAVSTAFFRDNPAFISTDFLFIDEQPITDDLAVTLVNNIIWGRLNDEVLFLRFPSENNLFQVTATSNLLRTQSEAFRQGNLVNQDPRFIDAAMADFRLDTVQISPAIDAGLPLGITTDLQGNPRDALPDIGAFEAPKN
jgi:hypothetical protein